MTFKARVSMGIIESPFSSSEISSFPNRTVYPELGSYLDESHIGKKVVRVFPELLPDGKNWDWSHVAYTRSVDKILREGATLIKIDNGRIKLKGYDWSRLRNDKTWCTADELIEHLKKNPAAGVAFIDATHPNASPLRACQGPSDPNAKLSAELGEKTVELIVKLAIRELAKLAKKFGPKEIPANHSFSESTEAAKQAPPQEAPMPSDRVSAAPAVQLENSFKMALPENPGGVDYSYHAPQPEPEMASASSASAPDFTSDDPHEILGLDPNEKNERVIRTQYRALALRYHPDKEGDPEIFKKLTAAYHKLANTSSSSIEEFAFTPDSDIRRKFEDAMRYDKLFDQRGIASSPKEIEKNILLLDSFLKQLSSIDLSECQDIPMKLHFQRLIKNVASTLDFYQIKLLLASVKLPDSSLDNETRILAIRKMLEQLKAINLDRDHWNYNTRERLLNVRLAVLDKHVALQRSLVEIYLATANIVEFRRLVRNEAGYFIFRSREKIQARMFAILEEQADFMRKLDKHLRVYEADASESQHSRKETNPKEDSSAKKSDAPKKTPNQDETAGPNSAPGSTPDPTPKNSPKGEAPKQAETVAPDALVRFKRPKTARKPFDLLQENEQLDRNINKNHQFFRQHHHR